MGFTYAGNLGGAGSPVTQNMLASETCYVGQLVEDGHIAGAGGHFQIANVAAEANDDTGKIMGFVSGIVDGSRTYVASASGTAQYGDRTTYTTTQATIKANGPSEAQITLIQPGITLVRAPIFNGAW